MKIWRKSASEKKRKEALQQVQAKGYQPKFAWFPTFVKDRMNELELVWMETYWRYPMFYLPGGGYGWHKRSYPPYNFSNEGL